MKKRSKLFAACVGYDASSGWVRKGREAKASAEKAITGNQAFYDVMN